MRAGGLRTWGIAALVPLALLQSGCGSRGDSATTAVTKSSGTSKAIDASLEELQRTLTYNIINLSTWANRLRRMVEEDNLEAAKSAYGKARAWLGRIEPVLPAMPEVESPLLDSEEEGYPAIEQGLWTGGTDDVRAGMKGFHRDMERLRLRVERAGLEPAELPLLAIESLDSIGAADLTGTSDHLAALPLIKAGASIEGVRALFIALTPALKTKPSLKAEMKRSFADLFETLGRMEGRSGEFQRSDSAAPGTEFPAFEDQPLLWSSRLDKQVSGLAELFSQASMLPELQ